MSKSLDSIFEDEYIRLPRPLIKVFGLNTAVMLSELYSEYNYWRDRDQLTKDNCFYSTVENVKNNCGLSKSQQLTACKELTDYGIIKERVVTVDGKRQRYFQFNESILSKLQADIRQKSYDKKQTKNETTIFDDVEENSVKKKTTYSF